MSLQLAIAGLFTVLCLPWLCAQAPSMAITTAPALDPCVVGFAHTHYFDAAESGTVGPYSWSVVAGAIAPGKSLSPATGLSASIGGIATMEGVYTFTLEVRDSSTPAVVATRQFTVEITSASSQDHSHQGSEAAGCVASDDAFSMWHFVAVAALVALALRRKAAMRVACLLALALSAGPAFAQASMGLVPLNDLGTGSYLGYQGGLYPNGSNTPPTAHAQAGAAIAQGLVPLDSAGQPSASGRIVIASMGMCNTTKEAQAFLPLFNADQQAGVISPKVRFVDCAEGGCTAEKMADPNHAVWNTFAADLANQGATAAQLQVVWVKITIAWNQVPVHTFPGDAEYLRDKIKQSVLNLKLKYPAVKMVFLSSRIYAGWAGTLTPPYNLNPEPFSYRTGFSVKWLIEQQINGDASLAFSGAGAPAPWMAWGPYLWADGLGSDNVQGGAPGRSDGLEWLRADLAADGTHPSEPQGSTKVAQQLLAFFKTDANTQGWFLGTGSPMSLSITTSTLPNADPALAYNQTIAATSQGAVAPFTWSLAGGSLPPGITLDTAANGLSTTLSGTPGVSSGTYTFTVQIADSAPTPTIASRSFTLIVAGQVPPPGGSSGDGGGGGGGGCSTAEAVSLISLAGLAPLYLLRRRRAR